MIPWALVAALLCACTTELPEEPVERIRLTTTFYSHAAEQLAAEYNRRIPNVRVSVQRVANTAETLAALAAGQTQIAITGAVNLPSVYALGVFATSKVYVIARRDGGISTIDDLRRKRIGFERSTINGRVAGALLKAYGVGLSEVHAVFEPANQLGPHVADGTLDAALIPISFLDQDEAMSLKRSPRFRLLPISRRAANQLFLAIPSVRPILLPAGEFSDQDTPVESIGSEFLLVCRTELSERLAYDLTKELVRALPRLAEATAPATQVLPEQASATPIRLHPGAERYYRELEILR